MNTRARRHDQILDETPEGLRGGISVELLGGRIPIPDATVQMGDDERVAECPEGVCEESSERAGNVDRTGCVRG
jgi:hypothetical protein